MSSPIVVVSPGLNPSNALVRGTGFPNLARRILVWDWEGQEDVMVVNAKDIFKEVDEAVIAELTEAGIIDQTITQQLADGLEICRNAVEIPDADRELCRIQWNRKVNGGGGTYKEVPTDVIAWAYHWQFERSWYYYVATGPGIPPDRAEEFHKVWGKQVRVNGHCGCPSPLEACHGFAVGTYHIDTREGLKAFVEFLSTIYTPRKKS